jgi:hypothetical protein
MIELVDSVNDLALRDLQKKLVLFGKYYDQNGATQGRRI